VPSLILTDMKPIGRKEKGLPFEALAKQGEGFLL
jgi:hypothetical protein